MASRRATNRLAHLWQAPLLLLSLGLFATAAYLFVHPAAGLTLDQRIDIARVYLRYNRPEAALDHLNKLVSSERMPPSTEARIHLLLAESLEAAQKLHHVSVATNHERIIEQTRLGLAQGGHADAEVYRRVGESYEALGKNAEALESYRRAMTMDPRRQPHLQRKVIELQLAQADTGPADASIDEFLKTEQLSDSERVWALQRKAQLLTTRGSYIDAKAILTAAQKLAVDTATQGETNYRLGYCLWKTGETAEAERVLRVARNQLKTASPLDADAAYALGRIRQDDNDPKEAIAFYQAVLTSHPESNSALLSRLGRGECRIMLAQDDAGLNDLHELVARMVAIHASDKDKAEAIAGLKRSSLLLAGREKYVGALEALSYEQSLQNDPPADFYARLAAVYEQRANQLEKSNPENESAAGKIKRQQEVRELRTRGGDSWIACSRSLTVASDKDHGEAMWKGVELYDRAGNLQLVTSALELFAAERPEDGQTPEALLRLGRAYQASGLFDRAIAVFERNQMRYSKSLAASKSGVPLAQSYFAKGPNFYGRAEKVLLSVLDNPILSPDAEEFEEALFELAQLYYRTDRYEEAVVRLEEMTQRYPNDARMPQMIFLMADSFRRSAGLLAQRMSSSAPGQAEAIVARKERLSKAKTLYDKMVDRFRDTMPTAEVEKLYLKLSYFYRADCLYDLGQYEEAIRLYDVASLRYQDDSSALSAYVQIVNAYCELGKFNEARHANERAKTLLLRMPADAFNDGAFPMPREYWDRWLKWTSNSGMWNTVADAKPLRNSPTEARNGK